MSDPLRPPYDFALAGLAADRDSRGRVFRAIPTGSRVLDVATTGAAHDAIARLAAMHMRASDGQASLADLGAFDAVLSLDLDLGMMDRTHVSWLMGRCFERAHVDVVPVVPHLQELPRVGQRLAEQLAPLLPAQLGGALLGVGFRSDGTSVNVAG